MQAATFFTPDFNLSLSMHCNGPKSTGRSQSQSMKSFSLEKCDDEGETRRKLLGSEHQMHQR